MTIKKLQEENFTESYQLAHYAFRFKDDQQHQEGFTTLFNHSNVYAAFNEQELASQMIATPLKVQLYNQLFDMAGIGFVSSDPSFRGQGNIDQLMQKMLVDCYENGILLSYLDPFSYPFYRKYGYELTFERIHYDVESSAWPDSSKPKGYVRRKTWVQAKEAIKQIDQASSKHKHGGILREDWWYEYKFNISHSYYFAIYYNEEDRPEGYLVYKIKDGKFHCVRWVNLTESAYRGINRYISSHKDSTQRIIYEKGYAKNEDFFLNDNPIGKAEIRPEMMARIVDVESFLNKSLLKDVKKSFAITIEKDHYASWNEGTFEIVNKKQVNIVKKEVNQTQLPQLKISIQRLTQLLFGYCSIDTLIFYDLVEIDEEIIETIRQLTPQQAPILEDYF
ncbi:MAG: GNAT family N-acetyltransferase [Tetragenococcus halophilus]|nr:GNAT family N-acetyltransferase [Tetragenococcus halophilus]